MENPNIDAEVSEYLGLQNEVRENLVQITNYTLRIDTHLTSMSNILDKY